MYGPWYCPKLHNYEIMGRDGFNLFMSVQKCANAVGFFGGDPDVECEPEDVVAEYVNGNIQANVKFIG